MLQFPEALLSIKRSMMVVAEHVHESNYCNEQEHSNDKTTQDCGANPVHVEAHLQAHRAFSVSHWPHLHLILW